MASLSLSLPTSLRAWRSLPFMLGSMVTSSPPPSPPPSSFPFLRSDTKAVDSGAAFKFLSIFRPAEEEEEKRTWNTRGGTAWNPSEFPPHRTILVFFVFRSRQKLVFGSKVLRGAMPTPFRAGVQSGPTRESGSKWDRARVRVCLQDEASFLERGTQ